MAANADSNPYAELGEKQFTYILPDGNEVAYELLPRDTKVVLDEMSEYEGIEHLIEEGISLKPRILDADLDAVDNIAERAAENRVDFDYDQGFGDEAYRYVGPNNIYEIIGNENDGYNIRINGEYVDDMPDFIPLDEARIQIEQREVAEGNISSGLGNFDSYDSDEPLIDVLPNDVIAEGATIPTKYDHFEGYRLPMGGAYDYEEHTIHIRNPKTATRYSSDKGTKHFGGGDELFHIRTSIRPDENGKKVLFVEEIQSDLHSTARSTKNTSTYELPRKERQKINQQLEEDFGITQNAMGDFIYIDKSGNENFIDSRNIPILSKYITEGRTQEFGSKNAEDFVENFGFEKTKEIGQIVEKLNQGDLPDFPYKKDWVDLAVKEAMKLGAEKNVDRIAFTNAPTQIKRNNKSVYYNQDIIVNRLPTREELPDTPKFAERYEYNLKTRYDDYINGQHDTNLPIPTQEEYYASIPAAKKKANKLAEDATQKLNNIRARLDADIERFKQEYPDAVYLIDNYQLQKDLDDGNPFELKNAYRKLRQMEMDILAKRANANLDINADPRNVDVTNPALARLLDADLSFREFPEDVMQELDVVDKMMYEINDINDMYPLDEEAIKEITIDQLASEYKLDDYKYKLEKVGYPIQGNDLLNPQKIQLEGDDYDIQRYGTRMLDGEEALAVELGEDLGPKTIEKLQSGKNQVVIPVDELEGSGMKFLEIYKNEIPRGINKVLKDLKVKDVKPTISDILYADPNDVPLDPESLRINPGAGIPQSLYPAYKKEGSVMSQIVKTHSSIGIDLTDDMKRKILQEGLNNMYMGGKVSKSNSMDKPIDW